VLVGEIAVERDRRRQREEGERDRGRTNLVTENEKQSAAELDSCGHRERERRQRQSRGGDHRSGRAVSRELAQAAHHERNANENSADEGQITRIHGEAPVLGVRLQLLTTKIASESASAE